MSRIISLLLLMGVAACETVPATMDPTVFEADIARMSQDPNLAAAETDLSTLLTRADLTVEQRAEAGLLRGQTRLDARLNLPGAIADFDQFVQLQPEATQVALAKRRKLFASEEIDAAQRRLARLQNLSDWFDDKVLMGDIADGAARYQSAGLTPNPAQLHLLKMRGYVCTQETRADGEPVQQYGAPREDTAGAVWCEDPSDS